MFAFQSILYAGDVIFAEWPIPGRLEASTEAWGRFAKGVFGDTANNEEKLGEEGHWGAEHFILGFVGDTQNPTYDCQGQKLRAQGCR